MTQPLSPEHVCNRFSSRFCPPDPGQHLGIALQTLHLLPLNALRHRPDGNTCGWFIWGGELSQDPNFFQSIHVSHLEQHAPALLPYLALEPGWRVLLAPGHEDVWHDPGVLAV